MKKIVSAALVASMVAGAAFAADAKITLNHRTKLDAFDYLSTDNGKTKTVKKEWMDLAGYDGKLETTDMPSDSFKFVLAGDVCGATANFNLTNGKATAAMVLNEFSAWAKWEVGSGALRITTGTWKDGYADGSYRVKKDVDAWGSEGMDFERNKLGSQFGSAKSVFVDNLATVQQAAYKDNNGISAFVDYDFPVNDDVKLNILAGAVYVGEGAFDKTVDADSDGTTTDAYDAAPVVRVQFNMAELFNSELIWKKPAPRYNVFGLFFKPKMLAELDATIGATVEKYSAADSKNDYTALAFDLRARYQVSPEFSITTFNNLSLLNTDGDTADKVNGLVSLKGTSGWADGSTAVARTVLWDCIEARYKVNDTLTVMGSVGLLTPLALSKTLDDAKASYSPEWRVTPAVQVYAASNASVYAGVAISGTSYKTTEKADETSVMAVQVPVVFRVKM